jgi:hypothetical protein
MEIYMRACITRYFPLAETPGRDAGADGAHDGARCVLTSNPYLSPCITTGGAGYNTNLGA